MGKSPFANSQVLVKGEHTEVVTCTIILRSLGEMMLRGAGLRWNFLADYCARSGEQSAIPPLSRATCLNRRSQRRRAAAKADLFARLGITGAARDITNRDADSDSTSAAQDSTSAARDSKGGKRKWTNDPTWAEGNPGWEWKWEEANWNDREKTALQDFDQRWCVGSKRKTNDDSTWRRSGAWWEWKGNSWNDTENKASRDHDEGNHDQSDTEETEGDYWAIPEHFPHFPTRVPLNVDFDEQTNRFSGKKKDMKLKCDECGGRIEWKDRTCPLPGAFKHRSEIIGKSTKQIEHYWKEHRFDATYWCLLCWKKDRQRQKQPFLRDFELMVELGMVTMSKYKRMEAYSSKMQR